MCDRRPRRPRRLISLIVVVAAIAACCLVALRISQVNSVVPEHRVRAYALHEPVALAGGSRVGEEVSAGVTLTALDCALADQDEMTGLLPGYRDGTITSGAASDVKFLVVRLRLANGSDAPRTPDLTSLAAQEGAWHNGMDPEPAIFRAMNPDGAALELKPDQSREVLVLFEAYDMQFGFQSTAWDRFGRRGLQLVLATFPDKIYISLGRPGTLEGLRNDGGKGAKR